MPTRLLPFLLTLLLTATACGTPAPAERKANAEALPTGDMGAAYLPTQHFDLYSLSRISGEPRELLVVYIEGDGSAWQRSGEASPDPTPVDPTALKLALTDDAPAVAYLARPCQFADPAHRRNCDPAFWTDRRYGEEVVAATGQALDLLKQRSGARHLGLVGFSGGGAVALLVAARRGDVTWVKTVAAPLDTDAFTHRHHAPPLSGSLNPADFGLTLARLPQIHLSGADDRIVPPAIGGAYMERLPTHRCATLRIMPGVDHHDGWEDIWPALAAETPTCR